MSDKKMTLSQELKWRGQIKDKTFSSDSWLDTPRTFYVGTDCSSDSLTIGNLAVYMLARRLRKSGWKTVLLVGGATSLIGDPGGKDEERQLKSREEIQKNVAALEKQVSNLLDNKDFKLVDNYDWFKDIGYLEFLRDVGKNYSMTELLQRDFIQSRIGKDGSGISYAEFSYSLIQGYDFWHLYKKHGVVLQIGGSDQWGNMLSGVPLVRKKEEAEVHAMSMPLVINKATGKKFGKSEKGAVWLDAKKTSPYDFYQFWLNVDDDGVEDYLKIYTELDRPQIEDLLAKFNKDKSSRLAQKTLAYEVTKIVHGQKEADAQSQQVIFKADEYQNFTASDFENLSSQIYTHKVKGSEQLIDLLLESGLANSKTEARRFVSDGAVYLNGQKFSEQQLTANNFIHGYAVLRRGKNNQVLLKQA